MLFPDVVGSQRKPVPLYVTKVQTLGENQRVRYRKSLRPRWGFELAWDRLTRADATQIDNHVNAVSGGATAFDWFDWSPLHWLYVPIGTGDGATAQFVLPGLALDHATPEFFAGASALTVSSYTPGGDPLGYGRESVRFTSAPANGATVWMNGRLRRLFHVTFMADEQPLSSELETGYFGFACRLEEEKL